MRRCAVLLAIASFLMVQQHADGAMDVCKNTGDEKGCLKALDADAEMKRYIEAARDDIRKSYPTREQIEAFDGSQHAWETYRKAECDAVYAEWEDGSVRFEMYQTCDQHLTQQRTHAIWYDWLRKFGGPPILPEPVNRD